MPAQIVRVVSQQPPPDKLRSSMVIPVAKGTFFNTNCTPKEQLCPYDMLYHPPDYNPKSARSDRQEPKIIRKNIWDQEFPKPISSTTHFRLGRPKWPILDRPQKLHVRVQVKDENHMRIHHIMEWAVLINEGKPSVCDDQ